ncbi:hypothetical protein KRP22_012361 [Phytophthora ramorum]|nr:hypothetical protein KRP22_804 [Phytophthora ramorum]
MPIDALGIMMDAFQQKLQAYLSGSIPAGLLGVSARTYRPVLELLSQNHEGFIRNSIDLLPFVAVTSMTQTNKGVVRGFTAPRSIGVLLSRQQPSKVLLQDVVQFMN